MRKQNLSFFLEKNIVMSIFMQIYARTSEYRSETATNIVLADGFFFCFDYAWLVPLW